MINLDLASEIAALRSTFGDISAVLNPDKLGHLGPVADPWAVAREANQARRG